MKKLFIFLILPLLFACSSDDNLDDKIKEELIGTTWEHVREEPEIGKVVTYRIHFISDKKHMLDKTWYENDVLILESSDEYNYIFTPPAIILTMGGMGDGRGTIADNTMMISYLYEMEFTRIE